MSPRARQVVRAAVLVMVFGLVARGAASPPLGPVVESEPAAKPEDTMPDPGEVSPRRTH